MTCPVCGGDTIVVDSRCRTDTTYRRRKCLDCDYRFATYEVENDLYKKLTWNIDNFFVEHEAELLNIIHDALERIKSRLYAEYTSFGKERRC